MFGFSLTKLVFTIIAIAIVWHGFKLLSRKSEKPSEKKSSKASSTSEGVEEMVKCDSCGTFVAPGVKSCGRDDCPFPG